MEGTMGTAPFSEWSFTSYLTLIMPFLMIMLILMCTNVFSEKEKKVRHIVWATPLAQGKYYSLKAIALFIAFIFVAMGPILTTFIYYGFVFKTTQYSIFIKPMLLFLLPTTLLFLGIILFLGKINGKLLYLFIPIAFVMAMNFSLPLWADLYGNNFMYHYEFFVAHENESGIIPYVLPNDFLISRILFVGVSMMMLLIVCKVKEKES
jgi:hypothetical protein